MTEVKISKEFMRALLLTPLQACFTTVRSDDAFIYLGVDGPDVPKDKDVVEIMTMRTEERKFKDIS
jgi:hypothetical protein